MRRSITGQIIKLLQVFIHTFIALSEPHELRHFHGHQTWWDIGAAENLGELRPGDRSIRRKSGALVGPPNSSRPLQLMGTILNLQRLGHAEQAKLVFHGIDPLESLERFLSLQELWRIRVQKILESAILIHWAVTVASVTGVCCNVTQCGLHVALTAEELLEELLEEEELELLAVLVTLTYVL